MAQSMDSSMIRPRPTVRRSHTAHADLIPPTRQAITRSDTASTQTPKKHHLDFLHSHNHRRQGESSTTLPAPTSQKRAERSRTVSPHDVTPGASDGVRGRMPALEGERRGRTRELAEERRWGEERDDELRSSLNELSELAHDSTRRLDTIYYTLLEKVVTVRATIGSLQELSESSRKLHTDFGNDVEELRADVQRQIDAYASFKEQQGRVEEMEARVRSGQNKAKMLSERLETARRRVETWERREKEWQAKTSKRLKVVWGVLIAFAVVIMVFLTIRRWRQSRFSAQMDTEALKRLVENATLPAFAIDDLAQVMNAQTKSTTSVSRTATALSSDKRLAQFDEL